LGGKFHAVGAEKLKLRFPNLFVRTRGISSWPDAQERREARVGSRETGFMYVERYLGAMECPTHTAVVSFFPVQNP